MKEKQGVGPTIIPRCYNCGERSHYASRCEREPQPKGACYGCGSTDHIVGKCPQRKKGSYREVANVEETSSDAEFYRWVDLQLDHPGELFSIKSRALLDSGSPVSLIKECLINPEMVEKNVSNVNYNGINNSKLIILGTITVTLQMMGMTQDVNFLVVSNDTTK